MNIDVNSNNDEDEISSTIAEFGNVIEFDTLVLRKNELLKEWKKKMHIIRILNFFLLESINKISQDIKEDSLEFQFILSTHQAMPWKILPLSLSETKYISSETKQCIKSAIIKHISWKAPPLLLPIKKIRFSSVIEIY